MHHVGRVEIRPFHKTRQEEVIVVVVVVAVVVVVMMALAVATMAISMIPACR